MTEESRLRLREAAVALARVPMAIIDAEPFSLAPGEQAMAPRRWDKAVPLHDFGCAGLGTLENKVEVLPGVRPGGKVDIMLCLENTSPLEVTLERGDVVAAAGPIPEGLVLRRGGSDELAVGDAREALVPLAERPSGR